MWSADNGDQPSPAASPLLPPPPHSSPQSNKKKNRAGVNTGGVVHLFGNGSSGPGIGSIGVFFWLREVGRDVPPALGEGASGRLGARGGVAGARSPRRSWCGGAGQRPGGEFSLGWDVIDSREELSQ